MTDETAEAVAAILGRYCTPADVAAAEDSWHEGLWAELTAGGYTGVGVAEEHGGSGADLEAAATVIRVAARFAAPVPVAEHLMSAGWMSRSLNSAPSAAVIVAAATEAAVPATYGGNGTIRLRDGLAEPVPWGRCAGRIVLPIDVGTDGELFGLLEPDDVVVEPGSSLAREPRDRVRVVTAALPAERVLQAPPGAGELLRLRMVLARALQIAGAAEQVLALCVRYANEREQFGRPIGRFQAVQQSMAVLAGESAAASCATQAATAALAEADPLVVPPEEVILAVEAAGLRARSAATRVARIAHQVHGAIGFTKEHALHQFTLRLWSWRDEPEPVSAAAAALGVRLANLGRDRLWTALTGASS
jgi:acyl-CoA dehydrogenase